MLGSTRGCDDKGTFDGTKDWRVFAGDFVDGAFDGGDSSARTRAIPEPTAGNATAGGAAA
jgi:hypothetical protein